MQSKVVLDTAEQNWLAALRKHTHIEEGEEYGEDDLAEDDMSRDYMVMEPKMEEFVKEEAKEVKKVN